jgi:hypothetical protein
MTITIQQFDFADDETPYTLVDINNMNEQAAEVLQSLDDLRDRLLDAEWQRLARAVESEVTGNYDRNLGFAPSDCIPAEWATTIARLHRHG